MASVSKAPMDGPAEHAGFFAAHGIWCVSDGGPLTPMLAFEHPNGSREMIRSAADQIALAVEKGRQRLAENPEGATHAVLVIDGFITIDSQKTDALFIEAVQYVPERAGFTMAVPYRSADNAQGFAVYRPKFLGHDGPKPDFNGLDEAFFRGVDRHEKGKPVWDANIGQSR